MEQPIIRDNIVDENNTNTFPVNIMDIIETDDKNLIENNRIANMNRIDWGKTMAVPNEYIHRNVLRHMLTQFGYKIYSTHDEEFPNINIANNSPGFDLVIVSPENKIIRIGKTHN